MSNPSELPRVAVVGAGAIGAFFAAHLIDAQSADVTLCVRTPFRELVVESEADNPPFGADAGAAPDGAPTERPALRSVPRVLTDAAEVDGPADWVLLATKAHQTEGAAPWLRALVGPATKVVVLQNGVEHEQRVRPFVDPSTEIVPAVVYCGAEVIAPGHIVHRTNGFLIVPAGDSGDALVALYANARAGIRLADDFTTVVWQKLCGNVVANGITALTERRIEVMRRPDLAAVGHALVLECIAVARAEGAYIDDSYADLLLAGIAQMPAGAGTSMLYDRLAHRPMEQDAKYGAVLRAGERHGIATPLHATFAALLTAISEASTTA
jgi:2-dehydropantoate 2-reductase